MSWMERYFQIKLIFGAIFLGGFLLIAIAMIISGLLQDWRKKKRKKK